MQVEYAVLYFIINLLSFLLISIILYKTNGLSKMVAQRNFAMSIIAEMVFIISDTVYVMVNNGIMYGGRWTKFVCKEMYFLSTAVMCFFWFLYFEHLKKADLVRDRKKVWLASSVLVVFIVLLVINIFTGILFYVDQDGVYHRGNLFILCYIMPYIYVAVSCIHTVIHANRASYSVDKKTTLMMILFPIAPGAAGILQFVYPRLPAACGMLSLATLILYLQWIDQLISLDPLTGLNNRKQMNHFYDQWTRSHNEGEKLSLLLIDANRFKQINDTYGHIKGDMALMNIAEALKQACKDLQKRADIARYGGDEFAVLFQEDTAHSAEDLKKIIKEKLREINVKTNVPFELTVSIGIAVSEGKKNLKSLIDEADEQMYSEKKNR